MCLLEQSPGSAYPSVFWRPEWRLAADDLKRNRQLTFVMRECVFLYAFACFITDEKETFCDAILRFALDVRLLAGPSPIIRANPAPGFMGLYEDDSLLTYKVSLETGRVKNANNNQIAKKDIVELEGEILR